MKFKHVQNNGNSATINLFDSIGGTNGISGQSVANEMDFLINALEVKEIVININSGGGSVFDGFSIVSAIRQAKQKGIRVITNIEGIAASIAGIIAVTGDERNIVDFGQLMIHDPHFGSNSHRLNKKQKRQLQSIKDSLTTILTNNSGIEADNIAKLMSEETWLNADEAFKEGFIDNIISTERNDLREVNDAVLIFNSVNFDNQKHILKMELENKIKDLENSVSTQETTITDLNTEKVELTNKVNEVTNELKETSDKLESTESALEEAKKINDELKKTVATSIVENAINNGQIKKEKKEYFIELGSKDSESLNNILEGLPKVKTGGIMDQLEDKGDTTDPENSNNWTIREWETKNPNGLREMSNSNPELYTKLFNEFYNKEK